MGNGKWEMDRYGICDHLGKYQSCQTLVSGHEVSTSNVFQRSGGKNGWQYLIYLAYIQPPIFHTNKAITSAQVDR